MSAKTSIVSTTGETLEGVVVSGELQKHTEQAMSALFDATLRVQSASQMVYGLACETVHEAYTQLTTGNATPNVNDVWKLAKDKWDAVTRVKIADFRAKRLKQAQVLDEKGEELKAQELREALDAFLDEKGTWITYVRSFNGAIQDRYPFVDIKTGQPLFASESKLRASRKAGKDAARARTALRQTLKGEGWEITDDQFNSALKALEAKKKPIDKESIVPELLKAGATEMEESHEEKLTRIFETAETTALEFVPTIEDEDSEDFGQAQDEWLNAGDALQKILSAMARLKEGDGQPEPAETARILNKAYVDLCKANGLEIHGGESESEVKEETQQGQRGRAQGGRRVATGP